MSAQGSVESAITYWSTVCVVNLSKNKHLNTRACGHGVYTMKKNGKQNHLKENEVFDTPG